MEPHKSTVGQILVNSALPKEFRDYSRVFDKKTMQSFLAKIGSKVDNDTFAEIVQRLSIIGLRSARGSDKASFSLSDFKAPAVKDKILSKLRAELKTIIQTTSDLDKRDGLIIDTISNYTKKLPDELYKAALKDKNPFAIQILSGSRGNKSSLSSLFGADLMYMDNRERPIPLPVLKSYAEGLDPIEYWAGTYGTRAGIVAVNLATAEAGYLGKRLTRASHRLVATDEDINPNQALAVDVDDADNLGAVLARDYGALKRGTPIDARVMKALKDRDLDEILIYSPIAASSKIGGLPVLAAGVRESGKMTDIGANIGINAAQALAEPVSQSMLSKKHTGGVATGKRARLTGFEFLEQLIDVPKTFVGGAPTVEEDGIVGGIRDAPQGGKYIKVNGKEHYASADQKITVKPGQKVEAGDSLTDGTPNPKDYVRYKGIGEGRRLFMKQFTRALKSSGVPSNRRNVEVIARGLINAVRLTGENVLKGHFPDDIVSYDLLESKYKPRKGSKLGAPKSMVNSYLEAPYLHYSIGTRLTPSVVSTLDKHGYKEVEAHMDKPLFEPDMQRAQQALLGDPDWMTQLGGFNLKRTFLNNVRRGATSNVHGTSWIPALATGEISSTNQGHY